MYIFRHPHWFRFVLLVIGSCLALTARAVDLTGAGASSPLPVYAKWAAHYYQASGHRVNFQSIGSGGGQQQIIAGTVDFGATDDPMPGSELARFGLCQFPAVIGGTVPVVNLQGIGPGQLMLTGPVLADIYLGRITRWDDPAIVRLNPALELPARNIIVVYRSDGSGTTFNWTHYLSQVSPSWQELVGHGKAVRWPAGQGGKGNEGVSAYVRQLSDSIGYVEYAFAYHNNLSWVRLQNRAGEFVQPQQASFRAAARQADWDAVAGMGVVLNNQPGAQSWPITAASFILVPCKPRRTKRLHEVLAFFDWAWRNGEEGADSLGYVSLPANLADQIRARWSTTIVSGSGQPVWP